MKLISLFGTADMPEDIADYLIEMGCVVEDAYGQYRVGGFTDEYDKASPIDKAGYDPKDVEMARYVDDWFIVSGATRGEKVAIEEGNVT